MPQPLRDYQLSTVVQVLDAWQTGQRCVLLVAPTGAGKTRLGAEFVYRARAAGERVLWIVHRRELLKQAADRLRLDLPPFEVAIIGPGESFDIDSPVQVATVQTLLARNERPRATLVVFDEAHHYAAEDWVALVRHYRDARLLGLTATPERQDGRPLGDIFQALVVAAPYSQLIRDGHLVPCRVYQPPEALAGNELAKDPLAAWQQFAEGSRSFVFCSSVDAAYALARRFRDAGVPAGTVEAKTPKDERDSALERFSRGQLTVLTNVYTMTEGVDVPEARCAVLARGCSHVGAFLQMAGRILRPAPGKTDAILIDLSGATLVHGLPTEDREYSLEGVGIKRTSLAPLRNCEQCGATIVAGGQHCPECGFVFPIREAPTPRIYDMELRAVYAGADTPVTAQQRELDRLVALVEEKGFHPYFAIKSFRDLFHRQPIEELAALPLDVKRRWFLKFKASAEAKGKTINQARGLYKATFGKWPDWNWR